MIFGLAGFGVGVIGTMLIILICKILGDALSSAAEEKEKQELEKRGLEKIKVTRNIQHKYTDAFGTHYVDETREEEQIVPIKRSDKQLIHLTMWMFTGNRGYP